MNSYSTIDDYISKQSEYVQKILNDIRDVIKSAIPNAKEKISYGMPTFDINNKHAVHFAAFKNHIGFFPTPSAVIAFKESLKEYKTSKGTIQFPFNNVPLNLINEIAKFRKNEIETKI